MAALIEGLAGVRDRPQTQAYAHPQLAPRWDLAADAPVKTIVRYAASQGYVAYTYAHDPAAREIRLSVTGSGEAVDCHLLLPAAPASTLTVEAGGAAIAHQLSTTGPSPYVDFTLATARPQTLRIHY